MAAWRAELVAHSGPNTLLWSDQAIALDITHAHPGGLAKLLAGKTTRLTELYREASARERAISRARVIRAKERELDRERGVPGSFLAIGRATWTERRGPKASAPVFLRPCEVVPHDPSLTEFDVVATGELEFNPALRSFLETTGGNEIPFDVLVRMSMRPHGFDPSSAYEALNRAWAGPPGWSISPDMWLTTFPYAKLSAIADFRAAIAGLDQHPVLQRLVQGPAMGPDQGRLFAPAEPELVTVLDADPGQIAVIEAVRGGRTVVVDAAPGTGKSQTIVNVAADQARAGRRVLVVAASAGSRAAVAGRLRHTGLGALLHEPGQAPLESTAVGARRAAAVQSDWSSAGRELREHVARMHRVRDPWQLSLHQLQERIAAVCERRVPPRSKVRLSGESLAAMGPEQLQSWAAVLSAAAQEGAWPGPGDPEDPWWGAKIGDAHAAARARGALRGLGAPALADFDALFRRIFDGVTLPPLPTLAAYGEFVDGMGKLTTVLDSFRLGIFEAPLEEWTGDSGTGAFDRWKHDRAIKALLRPGASPADTQALLADALAVRPLWQHVRSSRVMPGQVQGIEQVHAAYGLLVEHVRFLGEHVRGVPDLRQRPLADIGEHVSRLEAAQERLDVLVEVSPDLDRARAAGLGELIADFAERRVTPEAAATEAEFVWLASVLAHVTTGDPGYARVGGDQLRAARSRFRDVDRSLQAGFAAGIAAAADPRDPPIWLCSPYAVGLHLPPGLTFDVVIVDDAQALSSAEAASALARAPQALILGDAKLPGPTPFTATAGGAVPPAGRGAPLLMEAAALWPVHRLEWHYRSQDRRLIDWPAEHAYAGRLRTFPSPRDVGAYRVDSAPVTENDHGLVAQTVRTILLAARLRPKESLGVVTLTPDLADRIRSALARAMDSSVEEFFGDLAAEPFVVLDAAHTTGLVRDAVLVVLGQNSPAEVAGPKGAALLNAALTRSRARTTVIHSLDPRSVRGDAGEGPARAGLRLLADSLSPVPPPAAASTPSVLIADLSRRLIARGLSAKPGLAPGIVDLAVSDPFARGAARLAVQVDGPGYAALGSIRMRDRLVQEQLRRLGWRPLKILEVDLFRDPAREEARIVAAMERLAAGDVRTGPIPRPRRAVRAATGGAPDAGAPHGAATAEGGRGATADGGASDGAASPGGGGPRIPAVLEQTRDDTDAGWGEASGDNGTAARERWLTENRPPHWG